MSLSTVIKATTVLAAFWLTFASRAEAQPTKSVNFVVTNDKWNPKSDAAGRRAIAQDMLKAFNKAYPTIPLSRVRLNSIEPGQILVPNDDEGVTIKPGPHRYMLTGTWSKVAAVAYNVGSYDSKLNQALCGNIMWWHGGSGKPCSVQVSIPPPVVKAPSKAPTMYPTKAVPPPNAVDISVACDGLGNTFWGNSAHRQQVGLALQKAHNAVYSALQLNPVTPARSAGRSLNFRGTVIAGSALDKDFPTASTKAQYTAFGTALTTQLKNTKIAVFANVKDCRIVRMWVVPSQ